MNKLKFAIDTTIKLNVKITFKYNDIEGYFTCGKIYYYENMTLPKEDENKIVKEFNKKYANTTIDSLGYVYWNKILKESF